jgi:hypothetical protein
MLAPGVFDLLQRHSLLICPSGSAWDQWSKSIPVNIVARTRRFVVLSKAELGRPVLVAKIFWFSHPPNHF